MSSIFGYPKFKAFDINGAPLAGGKLYTYISGTTTPAITYSDSALSVPNSNPIILDSIGEAVVWGGAVYKFILKDANDVTIWTVDNIITQAIALPVTIDSGGTGATTTAAARSVFGVNTISRRNKLINGAFRVNQRGHTSGTALAQGVPSTGVGYGHDGWRAGASGCTYTFTQSKGPTAITITAGSLISKVEDVDIDQASMVLSWTGTAQARVGVNGAGPSGSYASSPILINATVGASVAVEFGTGTVDRVQLENGSFATLFEWLSYQQAEALCQRYCPVFATAGDAGVIGQGNAVNTTNGVAFCNFSVPARVPPAGAIISSASHFYYGGQACTAITLGASSSRYIGQVIPLVSGGLTANTSYPLRFNDTTNSRLRFTGAEL